MKGVHKIKSLIKSFQRSIYNSINEPAIVLLYHRVIDLQSDPQLLTVAPNNFYEQIKYLKSNFNLLTIEEFLYLKALNKDFPPKSVILTFDDGYFDNYKLAIPILESLETEAIFYISTSKLNTTEEFWWDNLERVFLIEETLPKNLYIEINERKNSFSINSKDERLKVYYDLHPLIKFLKSDERDNVILDLLNWAKLELKGRETHRSMTFDELKLMSQSKCAIIGAHTHTHPSLAVYNRNSQFQEIESSKKILEGLIQKQIIHFSYPYGTKWDYNKDTINVCKDLQFKLVSSNFYNQVHSWTSPYEIPRILVRNWNIDTFKANIHQFFKN